MRKFILIVPLLFVSAAAYAESAPGLTVAASETIERIKPAEKPAVTTQPPARTNSDTTTTKKATKTNTDAAQSARGRKNAKPVESSRSARRRDIPSRRPGESDEDMARRIGSQYGITW